MSKSKAAKSKPAAKSKIETRVEAAAPAVEPTVATVADAPIAAPASKVEGAVEQNGIKRPAADSLCGRVWQALDDLRAAGADPTAKNAAAAFDGVAIAAATIRTQTQRWKTFHSIKKAAVPAVVSGEMQQQSA